MKKTLAAVGASIVGVAGALVAAAAPAAAEPTPAPACTDALNDHVVDSTPTTGNWYMECVPQYGMGKAEFSITAPARGFPAHYSLTDGHQTVVTSSPTAAQVESYFDHLYTEDHSDPKYTGSFINLTEDTSASTATTQVYDQATGDRPMTAAFPITSVTKITTGLPAACTPGGETYDGEYAVTYAPSTTTFSQTIGTKVYKTTVTLTSPTLYLGLNFDSSGPFGFNADAPLCASSTAGTILGESFNSTAAPFVSDDSSPAQIRALDLPTGEEAWITVAWDLASSDPFDVSTLLPVNSAFDTPTATNYGTFGVTATPLLAETGVDAAPAGLLGGALLALGTLFGGLHLLRSRRRSRRS